ncbi:fimbria/pilus outer membrane usher protein, partial [Salmonella enterica subsp. enterica serovar Infantis]
SMKGFAPTIHGIARINAQVTILQNCYIINQRYVPPGAFTINDLYPTAASGDLTVEVKVSDGSINRYNVHYSAVPILQRE